MLRVSSMMVLGSLFSGGPVAAQSAEEAVLQPVRNLFDAMRAKDTVLLRSVFHESAQLTRVSRRDPAVLQRTPVGQFVTSVGNATVDLDERIWDWVVQVDDNIATVWTKYDILVGGEFSHCGVDAFQLAKLGGVWKIVFLSDTFRQENCWRYPGEDDSPPGLSDLPARE